MFAYRKYNGDWRIIRAKFPHREISTLYKRWNEISNKGAFWDIDKDTKILLAYLDD